jgi:hypothetical protein
MGTISGIAFASTNPLLPQSKAHRGKRASGEAGNRSGGAVFCRIGLSAQG